MVTDNRDKIPATHIEAILRTPFGAMFKALYNRKVHSVARILKTIARIIGTYSEKEDAFKIGEKMLKLTPNEVAVTFGLPKVGKNIVVHPRIKLKKIESKFQKRQFE